MSADNGIYILITAKPPIKEGNCYTNQDGYEYRVSYAQAIDNIDYSDIYLPLIFGNSKIYCCIDDAQREAVYQSEQCDILEYGISTIDMSHKYFPNMTSRAAQKALDIYEGAEPLDYKKE